MDLLERHGFKVSMVFLLLSVVVASVKHTDPERGIVRAAEDGSIVPIDSRKLSVPEEMTHHRPACPCDKCNQRRRLDQDHPKQPPPPPSGPEQHPKQPPPPPNREQEKIDSLRTRDTVVRIMRLTGGILSLSILLLPFISCWSSGSVENALKLYSEVELGCAALASYGWLSYGVLQVSFEDQDEIVGIDAIVINGFSWGFIAFMLVVVLLSQWQNKGVVCLVGLVVHIVLTIALLQFPIFKWVHKKSREKLIFGVIAALFQNSAELIPLIMLIKRWSSNPPQGGYPPVRNYKKFIIISRAFDSLAAIYWMLYCVLTYEFDEYGFSSIIAGGLSVVSLCAYSAWALKPN